jgi:phosphate transport system substrate-binding protein
MKIKLIAILMAALALTSVFAGASKDTTVAPAAPAAQAQPYTLEVGGSTSVGPLMALLSKEYSTNVKPNVTIHDNAGGSGPGINNAGSVFEIGMSSRELTPEEKGKGLKETMIATDGIAAIVNSANPVTNLTKDQILGIYTGTITDWSQVSGGAKSGPIAVVSREEGSGTRGAFEELVGFVGKMKAGVTEQNSTGAVLAAVAGNPDAIGYDSLGSVNNTVKALSVGGVAATVANVLNGSYGIARPFILLTATSGAKAVTAEGQAFIDWILSPAGQAIVKTSWIPVN